jgi:DNA-binding NarL/FixJ family response regulator
MIRLYLIEDNANIIVPGMRSHFRGDRDGIKVSGYSVSVAVALRDADPETFDIIVLDLWLPDSDPVQNVKKLSLQFPGKPIIIYTQDDDRVWRKKMLQAGVKAYLLKDCSRDDLKIAFKKVFAGETFICGNFKEEEQETIIKSINTGKMELTPVQQEMVDLLTKGLKREEIASKMSLSTAGVDKIFTRLRHKYTAKTNYELIRILMERGLI